MSKVVQRNYSIVGKSLDEIVELVRLVLSYEGEVSKVVITRGNMLAEYVAPNVEPPYGRIPETPVESIGGALSRVSMEAVDHSNPVDLDAVSVISSALVQAHRESRTGVAWVISDPDKFQEWLGLKDPVARLLNIPVYKLTREEVPEHNLILLCGRTEAMSPLKSDYGILIDMEN